MRTTGPHRSARPRRTTVAGTAAALCVLLLAGCSGSSEAGGPGRLPTTSCGKSLDEALARSDRAVRAVDSRVAVGLVLIDRRGAGCISTRNATETFPTASVVKLLISIDLLTRDPAGSSSAGRVRQMLAASDDTIASALWVSGGENAIITRTAAQLGLASLSAPATAGEWGSTRIDAADVARIWQWVLDNAPDDVREPILDGTAAAHQIAADGFDQYFGIPDALPGSTWWIKQGWGSSRGRRIVNTTGVVGKDRDHVLVMLTSHPIAVSFRVAAGAATAGVVVLRGAMD